MPEAKHAHTIPNPNHTNILELLGSAEPLAELIVPDGVFLPGLDATNVYALRLLGDCLEPVASSGEHAIISPTQPCEPGDFVALLFGDERGALIKRLVMPPIVPVGTPHDPRSSLHAHVIVEMLNPRRVLQFRVDHVQAMHRVIGFLKRDGSMLAPPVSSRVRETVQ